MAKRIYATDSRLKKYAIRIGVTSVPLVLILFWFLASLGSIDITGYSGDVVCDGTELDPCFAYINFTANEDIFIYPNEDWSGGLLLDKPVKEITMSRSWGKGWRDINLTTNCKGTWCGAPDSKSNTAYSYAIREGRDYEFRYKLLKNSPMDTVKWGFGPIDPFLYGWEDNVLEYSNNDLIVNIEDALGGTLIKLELKSHKSIDEVNHVQVGKNMTVMFYNFNSSKKIIGGLGEVMIIDMNSNQTEEKDYYFAERIVYEECEEIGNLLNGSLKIICEEKERWDKLENNDIPEGEITIGLVTDVVWGDHYDAEWTIAGKRISKHAEWDFITSWDTDSLNDAPRGIATNSTFIWIMDQTDKFVYKYFINGTYTNVSFGVSPPTSNIPLGITTNSTFIWVSELQSNKIYKFFMNGTDTGDSFDIGASGNGDVRDITQNSTFFWTADGADQDVYKYFINGTYTGFKFDTSAIGNSNEEGITTDNSFIWVTDNIGDEVYKHYMNMTYTGSKFDLNASGNNDARGITTNETFFWVTDFTDDKVYVYEGAVILTPPTITLNSPVDFFNTSNPIITTNGTISVNAPDNVTLFIDDSGNETNSTGILDDYIFSKEIAEGVHTWNYQACNSAGCSNGTERNFTIDKTNPLIEFVSPTEINEENRSQTWIFANVSITETNFQNITFGLYWENLTIINITTRTTEGLFQINWTSLPDGKFTYNVTTFDFVSHQNTTENRNITLETVFPLIDFVDPTLANNSLVSSDWIFANVSLTEINFQNITFNLWNSTALVNSTFRTTQGLELNWTGLPGEVYYYNVETFDISSNFNTTGNRTVTLSTFSIFFDGILGNNTAELGTLNLIANSTANITICIDIVHPAFGNNYSCGFGLDFNFSIDYFRNINFSDTSGSKIFNFSNGAEVFNLTFNSHQYDEPDNLTINISGTNQPFNVIFYNANSTPDLSDESQLQPLIDRFFDGQLIGSNIFLDEFFDNSNETNLSFSNPGTQLVYLLIDDIMGSLIDYTFFLNMSGFEYGFEFLELFDNNTYNDVSETTMIIGGGFLLPSGINPQFFKYDSYDSSIDILKWFFGQANGGYTTTGGSGNRYGYTISNSETSNFLKLFIDNFQEEFTGSNEGTRSANNSVYLNRSDLNIWTTGNIIFEILYEYAGTQDQDTNECHGSYNIDLGLNNIWNSSNLRTCYDYIGGPDYNDCIVYMDTNDEKLNFNLTRQINNSWKIDVTGSERRTGVVHSTINTSSNPECGTFTEIFNYTSGRHTLDYTANSWGCANTNVSLDNSWYTNNLEYDTVKQLLFKIDVSGHYDEGGSEGCETIDSYIEIYPINQSLFNITNTTYRSEVIQDLAFNLTAATLDFDIGVVSPNEYSGEVFAYLSADNGENWENVAKGVEHAFSDSGKQVKFRLDINFTGTGYLTNMPFFFNASVISDKSFPNNISFDFGNDGTIDANFSGEFNSTNRNTQVNLSNINLFSAFVDSNKFAATYATLPHTYKIPISISTDSAGLIELKDLNLTYNPNPVSLNSTNILSVLEDSVNFTIFRIPMSSANYTTTAANVTIDDVRYDYAGGNQTILFTIRDIFSTLNETFQIIYHYSRWDYSFVPLFVNYLEFIPNSPTSVDVVPYGQNNDKSILNITNYGYDGNVADLSVYLNDTFGCINLNMSTDNNISNSNEINESWLILNEDTLYLEKTDIWMWANYSCSSWNNFTLFNPDLYFRQCVDGGLCSTSLI